MFNHAPKDYICPICLGVKGVENEKTMIMQEDFFYRDKLVSALINSKFVGNNPGHVIIVPNGHFENIFDLPEKEASRIIQLAKLISLALKDVRKCDGIMLQQNNEPASGQHAFHFHLHIFPRFNGDEMDQNLKNVRVSTPEERLPYSNSLKEYFAKNPIKFD